MEEEKFTISGVCVGGGGSKRPVKCSPCISYGQLRDLDLSCMYSIRGKRISHVRAQRSSNRGRMPKCLQASVPRSGVCICMYICNMY